MKRRRGRERKRESVRKEMRGKGKEVIGKKMVEK